ncbi:MAG: glycosyltransferase family 2 protein [bacterium]|nr:glycosyltransferase family 2 protein [bacterium]
MTQNMPGVDLSISIVHHKNRELLEECLDSILKETKSITFEIFVIDNCSNDKISELLKKKHPKIKLIQNAKAEGFASNHNKALKVASGRYLLILNNDTVILDSAFDKMVNFMDKNPTTGAVGCKQYLSYDIPQLPPSKYSMTPFREFFDTFAGCSGIQKMFRNSNLIYTFGCSAMGPKEIDFEGEVAHINGACMMVRKSVVEQVGLLDENYTMFLEETDWCFRIKQAGWKIYYYPKAYIIHYGAKSLGFFDRNRKRLHEKSLSYFFRKHYGKKGVYLFKGLRIIIFPFRGLFDLYLFVKNFKRLKIVSF